MTATPLTLILLAGALIYQDRALSLLLTASAVELIAWSIRRAEIAQYEAEAEAMHEQRMAEMASRN